MKVLEINTTGEVTAQPFFPDAEIEAWSFEDERLNDSSYAVEWDIVFAHQCLQHIKRVDLTEYPHKLSCLVKNGGEVWVTVPSAEYAGLQIVKNEPDPIAQYVLFGQDGDPPRHAMFTLKWLRELMESGGLITRKASLGGQSMTYNGKEITVPQNVWIGMRYDAGLPDPADAIS